MYIVVLHSCRVSKAAVCNTRIRTVKSSQDVSARKSSRNPAVVEFVHWKPVDVNPGSPFCYKFKTTLSSELVVRMNLEGGYEVEIPPPRSFWCGLRDTHIARHPHCLLRPHWFESIM